MTGNTFPDYDLGQSEPVTAKDASIRAAEKMLLGFAAYNLSALDHADGLQERHFLDDDLRTVFRRLLAERAAGSSETDPDLVGLTDVASPAELDKFERQAPSIRPDRIKALARKVIEGWQGRELRRSMNVLGFDDGPVSDRIEAARRRLDHIAGAVPGRAAGDAHPLAQFVEYDTTPKAVRWVIPGVVEHGVVTVSGARGVGKTTCILPLAMTAAGLHGPGDPLAPKHWRHCVYIVEHVEQAQRIVAGMVEHGNLGIGAEDVRERLHIVEARRLDPAHVAQVGKLYRERFTRTVNGVEVLPLVVLDTKAAVLDLSNENDNAEASRAVYALKQGFAGLPTWIIGHVAKAQFGRTDVAALSDRGAGSFEADAIQNAYLVQEGEARYLLLGKRRFEARWPELQVVSHMAEVTAYDEWGDPETTTLRWGIVTPADLSRQEARKEAQEAAERERRGDMRQAIFDAVQIAWQAGNPLSKTGVKTTVSDFKKSDIWTEVEALLSEGWLYEVEVPKNQRTNTAKARFLVKLDTPEHEEFRRSGIVPAAKLVIPQSWRKPEIPPVPEISA